MERKLLLLGVLRRQEMHGYQLVEFIERALANCTDLKKSTAYYLLKQMAEEGWISEEVVQDGNRPPRRVYHLTGQGEAEFQRLLRANLGVYTPAYFPGDMGVAFLDDLTPDEALACLGERRAALLARLQAALAAPPHPGSLQHVLDHQVRHLECELAWTDDLISRYAASAG